MNHLPGNLENYKTPEPLDSNAHLKGKLISEESRSISRLVSQGTWPAIMTLAAFPSST